MGGGVQADSVDFRRQTGILREDRRDKRRSRALSLGTGDMDCIQTVQIGALLMAETNGISDSTSMRNAAGCEANLVPDTFNPFNHLRNRCFVHIIPAARLVKPLDSCKISLQRIERCDCILEHVLSAANP